jgi:hypothetical protein
LLGRTKGDYYVRPVIRKVNPLPLMKQANAIASSYGDKGAIILTYSEDGIRIGTHGLNDREIQETLCVGIYYNYLQTEKGN